MELKDNNIQHQNVQDPVQRVTIVQIVVRYKYINQIIGMLYDEKIICPSIASSYCSEGSPYVKYVNIKKYTNS